MYYIFQIYPNELENQPEYNGFKEWLLSFDLYRGKKTGDDSEDENRVVGTFKVSVLLLCDKPLLKHNNLSGSSKSLQMAFTSRCS